MQDLKPEATPPKQNKQTQNKTCDMNFSGEKTL